VIELYSGLDLEAQRQDAKAAGAFVEKQLPELEAKVKAAESELRSFRERNSVVDLGSEATNSVEAITNLNKEITTASAQLAAATSRVQKMRSLFGQDVQATVQSGLISESPGLKDALSSYQEIQKKLALERTRFQDNNPVVQDLIAKEQAMKSTLQQRFQQSLIGGRLPGKIVELQKQGIQESMIADYAKAEADRFSLEKQIAALVYVVDAYRQRMNVMPKLEQQQRELTRKLDISLATYKTLSGKLQEFKIAENQTTGNVAVITPATVPDKDDPISPKTAQNIGIGSFLGLFLGAAAAFILDGTDRRIKTAQEARQILSDYPVLGSIPTFEQKDLVVTSRVMFGRSTTRSAGQLINRNGGSDRENEAFRSLQANLRFLNADNQIKVIVVSSSLPREGKSTVAANLALVTAELGRRVLLVDGDMRKPSQHRIWRQNPDVGLSNVLTGQSRPEEAIIEVEPNLSLLTSGVLPPNPIALIDSSQMGILVAEWAKAYDLVIIDAPPLTVAADATLLSKQANGIVFVVRPNVADKDAVISCQEILEQSDQNVLGMVINGVQLDSNKLYKDYYYNSGASRSALSDTTPVEGIKIRQDS
jgi:capsular exopolysaccharide synthesis family protein